LRGIEDRVRLPLLMCFTATEDEPAAALHHCARIFDTYLNELSLKFSNYDKVVAVALSVLAWKKPSSSSRPKLMVTLTLSRKVQQDKARLAIVRCCGRRRCTNNPQRTRIAQTNSTLLRGARATATLQVDRKVQATAPPPKFNGYAAQTEADKAPTDGPPIAGLFKLFAKKIL
jgi:hypothetical protein